MPTKRPAADHDSPPPPDARRASARFGSLVGRVYRQWRRQVDLSFKSLGLSDATRMPLIELYVRGEPLRQKDLADALLLDTSSLVRVLAYLRDADLIDWTVDATDRRSKRIALTASGRHTAALILSRSLEIEHTILADLTPEELEITRRSLQKIARRFDALGS